MRTAAPAGTPGTGLREQAAPGPAHTACHCSPAWPIPTDPSCCLATTALPAPSLYLPPLHEVSHKGTQSTLGAPCSSPSTPPRPHPRHLSSSPVPTAHFRITARDQGNVHRQLPRRHLATELPTEQKGSPPEVGEEGEKPPSPL